MRANGCAVVLIALVYGGCGGSGSNPLSPAGVNRPPEIVRVELVGYNVAGYGESLPLRVEVRDPDGDRVDCRYTPQAGRVMIDGSSPSTCTATYVAPGDGQRAQLPPEAFDAVFRSSAVAGVRSRRRPTDVCVAGLRIGLLAHFQLCRRRPGHKDSHHHGYRLTRRFGICVRQCPGRQLGAVGDGGRRRLLPSQAGHAVHAAGLRCRLGR